MSGTTHQIILADHKSACRSNILLKTSQALVFAARLEAWSLRVLSSLRRDLRRLFAAATDHGTGTQLRLRGRRW